MEVKVINKSKNKLPEYATVGSAGCDLMADFSNIDKIVCFNTYIKWKDDGTTLRSRRQRSALRRTGLTSS